MTKPSAIPNFFIIGAPKCGTTAMSEYLRAHPQVFMSFPKEPNFLATDLPNFHAVHSMTEYLNLFRKSLNHHKAIGEASVWYLYSRRALRNILELNPDAKIIVMLRNPIDFLESYHAHMLFSLVESEIDLEKAWALQGQRSKGINIPPACQTPMMLQYEKIARFGECMEEVYSVFPRERIKCVLFDDFSADPKATYKDIISFLGLEENGRTNFPRINERKVNKSPMLAKLMFSPPSLLRLIWRNAKKVFGTGIIRLANQLQKWNSSQAVPNPVSLTFKKHLLSVFKEDIIKLESLIGRDLSVWLSGNSFLERSGKN